MQSRNSLQWILLFYAVVSCGAEGSDESELDLSDMPRSICGYPSLHTDGKFPEWNTRLAQYLLGYALEKDIEVDGVFTDETTAQIEEFQENTDLEVNGFLNINTWPSLFATVTPTQYYETEGTPVTALQDLLRNTYGYSKVDMDGIYGNNTRDALADFQQRRDLDTTNGETVDAQTWHVLVTDCSNSIHSEQPGHYWFDAGWPQGNMSTATLECLHAAGFEYAVFECWTNGDLGHYHEECEQNIANAHAAGFGLVDAYMFPSRDGDPSSQVKTLVNNLREADVDFGAVMLDVEGDDYWLPHSQEDNRAFMDAIKKALEDLNQRYFVYSGSKWPDYFGDDYTAFSHVPLVYAHYDNVPSFYDYYMVYGGWETPAGKQFYDGIDPEILCDIPLDWDWSPSAFWNDRDTV